MLFRSLQSLDHKTRLATYNPSTIDVRGLHCKLVSILAGSLIGLMNSASNIDKGPINMFIKYVMEIILRTEKLSSYPQKYRKSIVQNGGSDHTENNQEGNRVVSLDDVTMSHDPFSMDDVDFDQAEVFTDMDDNI